VQVGSLVRHKGSLDVHGLVVWSHPSGFWCRVKWLNNADLFLHENQKVDALEVLSESR